MTPTFLVTVFLCLLLTEKAAGVDLGDTCVPDSNNPQGPGDCTDSHAICPATTKCECGNGYSDYGGKCVQNGEIGADCLADSKCTPPTSTCESSKCKAKAKEACKADTDCVSHSTCSSNKCACKDGYTDLPSGLCNGVVPQSVSSWLLTGSIITFLMTLYLQ